MKQVGFPPLVVYLSRVGTEDGVITATRPDDGYWARRESEVEMGGCGLVILPMKWKLRKYWALKGWK